MVSLSDSRHSVDPAPSNAFAQAVAASLEGLQFVSPGICPGCEECRTDHGCDTLEALQSAWETGQVCDEGHFSWRRCECCGSHLGGDRYAAHGVDSENAIVHFEVCVDCLLYLANGDEPEEWEGWPRRSYPGLV